jgi:hypothetical protein
MIDLNKTIDSNDNFNEVNHLMESFSINVILLFLFCFKKFYSPFHYFNRLMQLFN